MESCRKNALLSKVTIDGNFAYNWLTGRPPFLFKMIFSMQPFQNDTLEMLSADQLADTLLASEKDSLLKDGQSSDGFKILSNKLYRLDICNGPMKLSQTAVISALYQKK